MAKLTDESLMPWGKYEGVKMANVPASYLIWIYENGKYDMDVAVYILDNIDCLKQEIERERKN